MFSVFRIRYFFVKSIGSWTSLASRKIVTRSLGKVFIQQIVYRIILGLKTSEKLVERVFEVARDDDKGD